MELVVGRVGGGGKWAAGGGLQPPTGQLGGSMNPRSASHRRRQARGPKRHLTNTGMNVRPILPIYCPPWARCLSHEFTWLTKPAVEKQTSQLSLLVQQCMGSV